MKSFLIIGMGRFGQHLCKNLSELGVEIMIVDNDESRLEGYLPYVVDAKVGDCTNEEVLRSLGVKNFDVVFVCIGTNFQSSLETTSLVKDMGAKWVVSKANRDIHAKFLEKNGADEVIYPDRDIAEKVSIRYRYDNVYDFINLSDGYAIYEITPIKKWIGKDLRELDLRNAYDIHVIGIKRGDNTSFMPKADYIFNSEEHLLIIAEDTSVDKILKELEE